MKITFTIAHMNLGGAQRVCYNLICWLMKNTDVDVHLLICSGRDVKKDFDLSEIPHTFISGGFFRKIKGIRKELIKVRPDVLVTMGVPGALFDVPACAGLGIKHIISERNDPAHFGGSAITRIISRMLMRKADGFIFQTEDAQAFYGGEIAKRSVVIPNPLFIGNYCPTTQYAGEREKTIVTTGRLNKQKNHPLLIRAFKNIADDFPDYKLVIYGEGPERQNDEALISELGLQGRVLLPGAINDVPEKIYKSSLYVLSSDFEGMPNALMEAMALGLPCISTNCPCGGPRDLIENGRNGILIPVGSVTSLEEVLLHLIKHPEEAKRMGRNAMSIRESHSMDNICQRWLDYFKQVLS